MAGEEAFNFWELIEMMDVDHEREINEWKEYLEEKELEIVELKSELENKEAARKEAEERKDFWYRMNEATTKLVNMQANLTNNCKVLTEKQSFLEKGQRKPGRKKHMKTPFQRKQVKNQNIPMNLMAMNQIPEKKNIMTNMTMMNPIPSQTNLMRNLKTQILNQKMTTSMMTMPTLLPVLACPGLVGQRRKPIWESRG